MDLDFDRAGLSGVRGSRGLMRRQPVQLTTEAWPISGLQTDDRTLCFHHFFISSSVLAAATRVQCPGSPCEVAPPVRFLSQHASLTPGLWGTQ